MTQPAKTTAIAAKFMVGLLAAFFLLASNNAYSYEVNKKSIKKWFEQHDYLFTDEFFDGEEWLSLSYTEKYEIIQDYYATNEFNFDVRKGLLTLDLMFHLDDGVYKQYSVYAILDKIIAEMFHDDTTPSFYASASG